MSDITIWHNPRCSKSRETLALLRQQDIEPQVILYLETPPDAEQLRALLTQLGFSSARQLMRRSEEAYKEAGLDNPALSEQQLLAAMVANPRLIERPVVVAGNQARLGRPPQQVLEIL